MKKKKSLKYSIPFNGLKEGKHDFTFEVDQAFFENFPFSDIENADITVNVEFEKKSNLFNILFDIDGMLHLYCDRCNDSLDIRILGKERLIAKFDDENYSESTDDIIIISPSDNDLDLSNSIYEFISLLKPSKLEHKNVEDCNQDVIKKLNEISVRNEASEEVDPRWAALEKLKTKK